MLNADGHLCVYIVMCVSVNYAWLISRAKQTAGHLRVIRIVTRTDTPQFRGGNPYFFTENPYQSVSFMHASIYREIVHAIHIAMQFAKKNRDIV